MTGPTPDGPVFMSYRQSDGIDLATVIAWRLRAAGVPMWHDITDLPPGRTEDRVAQALAAGVSGGVLLITPEAERSGFVHDVELPRLLDLANNGEFVLAVANAIRTADGKTDYAAADLVFGLIPGTLSDAKQYPVPDGAGVDALISDVVAWRAGKISTMLGTATPRVLHIDVQTRDIPVNPVAHFNVRLRPPADGRLPNPEGLRDLRQVLRYLPRTVTTVRPDTVRITGGAHLSVAFALGASIPATLIGSVTVEDTLGQTWTAGTVPLPAAQATLTRAPRSRRTIIDRLAPRNVLAYVNLTPNDSDAATARLLEEHSDDFAAWETITRVDVGKIDPETAGPLIEEIAGRLRALVNDNNNAHLHLLLNCPYAVALLLGRLCNTLNISIYEWDRDSDSPDDARPQYRPALVVDPTNAAGAITDVLLTLPSK